MSMFSPFRFLTGQSTPSSNVFKRQFRTFPIAIANKPELEAGDKIILPQSAFQTLAHLEITFPMIFRINNPITTQFMHCGVVEFSAEEGMAYVPYWMMDFLCLEPGSMCEIVNVTLPKGTYVELQPHTYRFAELSNPRALLERALRNYATLTKGTTLSIGYLDDVYKIDVVNLKPADAVLIIETDMKVEFLPPKDNDEYEKKLAALRAARAAESSAAIAAVAADTNKPAVSQLTSNTMPAGSNLSSPAMSFGSTPVPSPRAATGPKRNPIFDQPGYTVSGRLAGGTESKSATSSSSSTAMGTAPVSSSSASESTSSDASALPNGVTRQVIGKWVYTKDKNGRLISREPVSTASKFLQ